MNELDEGEDEGSAKDRPGPKWVQDDTSGPNSEKKRNYIRVRRAAYPYR
jgi:hypothetical protein